MAAMAFRSVAALVPDRTARSASHRRGGGVRGMTSVVVDGREVRLTNLDKVLWPRVGMTKASLIEYYTSVAPVLLPHLAGRPLTLHRFPDGVEGTHWYETRAPAHP